MNIEAQAAKLAELIEAGEVSIEDLGKIVVTEFERKSAELLASLPPTTVIEGARWDRAISYSDSVEARCGCKHAGRTADRGVRDRRAKVHVVECDGCGASWVWGRA